MAFLEHAYFYNEITGHSTSLNEMLELPFPLFYDFLEKCIEIKKKEAEQQKKRMNQLSSKQQQNNRL